MNQLVFALLVNKFVRGRFQTVVRPLERSQTLMGFGPHKSLHGQHHFRSVLHNGITGFLVQLAIFVDIHHPRSSDTWSRRTTCWLRYLQGLGGGCSLSNMQLVIISAYCSIFMIRSCPKYRSHPRAFYSEICEEYYLSLQVVFLQQWNSLNSRAFPLNVPL